MTVSSTTARVAYTGDGATTVFAVPYPFLANSDVAVYIDDVKQGGGFTTSGAGGTSGTVTFVTAPANLSSVVILREMPYTQPTVLAPNGPFPAKSVEKMADRMMLGLQQFLDQIGRTLKFPISDGSPAADTIPARSARLGKYLAFDAGGDPVASIGTGADVGLRTDLAASSGSSLLGWIRSAVGAVARALSDILRDRVSVFDFMSPAQKADVRAGGVGLVDVTAAVQAAIKHAKTFSGTQTEVTLEWPAGGYNITSLNLVGASRIEMRALGNVNIYGTSVGGTSILDYDGGTITPTYSPIWSGNFAVQCAAGASYQYGVKFSFLTGARIDMSVSGPFSVNTIFINYCWDNEFKLTAGNSSGLAIPTVACGSNNVNRNNFNMRTTGAADLSIASIGFQVAGYANEIRGDFSSSQIGLNLYACTGCTFVSPYFEVNTKSVATQLNPQGNVFLGGLYQPSTNGCAFDLSSSYNTTIISPRIRGDVGVNRTAFVLGGGACYGLEVLTPMIDAATIDTIYTGTWRGPGNFAKDFKVLGAQWLSFPTAQVQSSDANTLDDYEEGTWTPVLTASTPGDLAVTYGTQLGTYTKIGRKVTVTFSINTSSFTWTTAVGNVQITGLPYTSDITYGLAVGTVMYTGVTLGGYTQINSVVNQNKNWIELWASNTAAVMYILHVSNLPSGGTVQLYGVISYNAPT
jgi:hypothetical protein